MRKFSIVVVDNDEDEQFFIKEGFDKAGLFDVLAQLENGDALQRWLQENSSTLPDIILSDLNMPGKNGYDILTELKADPAYLHIPIIITSTSSTPTIIERCLAMGASDYLVKPDTFLDYVPFIQNLHHIILTKNLAGK